MGDDAPRPEQRTRLRVVGAHFAEALLALGIVVVFFLAFMGILSASFPEGTGLHNLLQDPGPIAGSRDLHVAVDSAAPDAPAEFVAVLQDIRRKVREKDLNSVSWETAHGGQRLRDRHSVQTYERSGATISFDEGSRLVLGENSLVIVRRLEQSADRRQKRAAVVLLSGQVNGSVGPGSDDMELEVVTSGGTSRLRRSSVEGTDFRMIAHPDQSTTLQIYGGVAEVETGGRRVAVGPEAWVHLSPKGVMTGPLAPPGVPDLARPAPGERIPFRDAPPAVRFSWSGEPEIESYQFELARDAEFRDLVLERREPAAEFVHGNLPAGRYHWRVRSMRGGAESRPSQVGEFSIERDADGPSLVVEFPDAPVTGPTLLLRGRTEPGAQLFVAGQPVAPDPDGGFVWKVDLSPGSKVLVVEAYDAAGNVTTRSASIHARFQR